MLPGRPDGFRPASRGYSGRRSAGGSALRKTPRTPPTVSVHHPVPGERCGLPQQHNLRVVDRRGQVARPALVGADSSGDAPMRLPDGVRRGIRRQLQDLERLGPTHVRPRGIRCLPAPGLHAFIPRRACRCRGLFVFVLIFVRVPGADHACRVQGRLASDEVTEGPGPRTATIGMTGIGMVHLL